MDPLILLVEDEEHLARGLCFNLEAEGYVVERFETGEAVLERLGQHESPAADLMVLDIMLPGMSGIEVLRMLRKAGNELPILLLTACSRDEEIVDGLDSGADDYLTKPFALSVLKARVRGLLRRYTREGNGTVLLAPFRIGETTVVPERFEIERAGQVMPLTAKELGLLQLLQIRRGRAVSRGEILEQVWELDPGTHTRVVDTFVSRLRKMIEPDPSRPCFLLSVRSFGYRLVEG